MYLVRIVVVSMAAINTYSRNTSRPTQMSVRGWKARTSIRSFTDEASPVDDASSSLSLLSNLCYSCHTTLTSKSSRCTTTPSWDTQSEVHLLKWSCLVCTLDNELEHLTCSASATPRGDTTWQHPPNDRL